MPEPDAATAKHAWSLRRRLLLLTAIVTLAAWLSGGAAAYFITQKHASLLSDDRMLHVAQTLLSIAETEIAEIQRAGGGQIHIAEDPALAKRYSYQVWSPAPPHLLLTNGAGSAAPIAPFEQVGFVTGERDGQTVRTLVLWSEDRTKQIQVAEPLALREPSPVPAYAGLFGLFLLSLAALLAVGAWMINRATHPLDDSAFQLTQRSPDDLRPIEVASPPREVQPLLDQINALFLRFAEALERERRFTASAAHELRTPLAAVKVHAQVAQLTRGAPERRDALDKLLLSIDRASHMVDQLLTLSRVEGMVVLRESAAKLRLDVIAAHVIEDVRPLLARHRQRIDARLAPCEIEGMEFGVASLLRNLVDNSMRYAPEGSTIRVTVRPEGARAVATVEDAGPGIPREERQKVFERFYRLYSDKDGCGIGLSIVRTVAQVHRAGVDMDESDLGGLRVTVSFPLHRDAPDPRTSGDGDSRP